jgi:biopolymer transport protein ExbB
MKYATRILVIMVMTMFFATIAGTAFALDEEAVKKSKSLLDTLNDGGIIGHSIILMSVIVIALCIEHAMTIRRDVLCPPELLGQLEALFEEEEYEEAMTLCEANPNFLTNVVAAGLPKIGMGFAEIEAAMIEQGEQEAIKLHQKISYVSLLANMAPMMGLFGTVVGMILAFNVIAMSDTAPTPNELASGISMALVTTAEGLTVAMPALTLYFYFRNKVIATVFEIGDVTEELLERFRPVE